MFKRFPIILCLPVFVMLSFFGCSGDGDEPKVTPQEPEIIARLITEDGWRFGGASGDGTRGDYLIQNKYVSFVVQGGGVPASWINFASALIDADIRRDGVTAGEDQAKDFLVEVSPTLDFLRAAKPVSAEVVSDGSDGTAWVRVHAVDVGVPIIDAVLPIGKTGLTGTIDYILEKDARYLKIVTTVTNNDEYGTMALGDGIFFLQRARALAPGNGFGAGGLSAFGDMPYLIAAGPDISYGYMPETGTVKVMVDQANIYPVFAESEKVTGGGTISYTRYFAVGETVNDVQKILYGLRGEALGDLTVQVSLADAADTPEDYVIQVLDDGGAVFSELKPDAGNAAVFSLPPGEYTVIAGNDRRGFSEASAAVTVAAGDRKSLDITLPAAGRIALHVSGDSPLGSLDALPSKVLLQAGHDADINAGAVYRLFTLGTDVYDIAPGQYTVTVSRGFEYTLCRENITVEAGASLPVTCTLDKVVDTDGWFAADFHVHSEMSVDAFPTGMDRVRHYLAEGIEWVANTDHDHVSDFQPYAEATDLQTAESHTASELLGFFPGIEISPPWAHLNAYPVVRPDDAAIYFGAQWWEDYTEGSPEMTTVPDMCRDAREKFGAQIIQYNHPNDGTGYFDAVGFDETSDLALMSTDIIDPSLADTVELMNSGGIDKCLSRTMFAWFNLLNQGYYITGVGVSDSHVPSGLGYSRSYVRLGPDTVGETTVDDVVAALKNNRAQASSGPFVEVFVGDTAIGDTAEVTGGTVSLHIKIQAPAWMPLNLIKIYANGSLLEQIPAADIGDADGVRYEATREYQITEDTWFVVIAGAPDMTLAPLRPGERVLTVANPVFVDTDGNGFTPPGFISLTSE